MRKLRIAWFSPFDGQESQTAAAYFSKQLLPALRDDFDIEAFHADVAPRSDIPVRNHHFVRAMPEHQRRPFDLFFYQVEDSPSSFFSRYHLGIAPGLVLFHHYRLLTPPPVALYHSSFEPVIDIIHQRKRELPRFMVWPEHKGPIARRELALAGGLLFSQYRAFEEYHHFSESRLIEDPLVSYLPTPVTEVATVATGAGAGAPSAPLTVGLCAGPGMEGRAHKVLGALSLCPEVQLIWLIAEGERRHAEELVHEYGVASRVVFEEGRSPEAWQRLLPRIHLASHLHYSVFLSPFPYLGISLAHGVPVLASDPGEAPSLPEQLTFAVRPGEQEAQELALIFKRCAERLPSRGHRESSYAVSAVAAELARSFTMVARQMAALAPSWSAVRASAWHQIEGELSTPSFSQLGGLRYLHTLTHGEIR